nr:odorant receptor 53 [Graphosoma rubrolineatum]
MVKYFRYLFADLPSVLDNTSVISINPDKRFKHTFFLVFNAVMTTACGVSMYFLGVQKSLEGAAFYTTMATLNLGKQLIYFSRPTQVMKLLDTLRRLQNHHCEIWEKKTFETDSVETWNAVHTYAVIIVCYQTFILTMSVLSDFIIGIIFPKAPSLLLVQLPGQGIIELFEPRTFGWLVVTTPFIVWGYVSLMVIIGTESLTFIPIMYVKIELKMLRHKLSLLKEKLEKLGINNKNSDNLLKDIIKHHQRTIKALDVMKKTLGLPIFIQNTVFSIVICLDLYCIMSFNDVSSFGVKLNGLGLAVCVGFLLCGLCFFGESLENENYEIRNSIYDLAWYDEKKNFGRSVQIMIRQAQRPYVINYRLIANLNLMAFMEIMNATYSYFMMLKSLV